MKLIPDTNFLIYLAKYKLLDKLSEHKLILLKQVLDELVLISKGNNKKDKDAAELAIMFLKKSDAEFIDNVKGKADDAILNLAVKEKCLVGTMDSELIKRLKKENIKILIVRQKKYIEEK